MRKNKLYNRKDVNLFDGGGFTEEGWYTKNKEGEGVHLSTAGGLALGAMGANAVSGVLANGNHSGVGDALLGVGQIASVIPGPYGAAISMGLQAVGGLTNAAFGSNLNEAAIQEIKTRAADLAFLEFSHSSNEDLLALNQTMSMLGDVSRKDVGTQGWFSNKASKKAGELSNLNKQANMSMLNNYGNAVDTVAQNNFFNSIDTGNNILACGGRKYAGGGFKDWLNSWKIDLNNPTVRENLRRTKQKLEKIPEKIDKFLHTKPLEKPLKNLGDRVVRAVKGGNFGGGTFRGGGAGGTFEVSPDIEVTNFNDVFDAAVARGDSIFYFRGLPYTTKKELNPAKEMNNRLVGEGRKSNQAAIYDKQYGPFIGEPFNVRLTSNYWGNGGNIFGKGDTMIKRAQPIYREFMDAGISPVTALGVLGNMALESGLNPKATNKTHWGYLQNDSTIHSHLKKYYGGDSHKQQMQFIIDGLNGNLKGQNSSTGKMIQNRFNRYNKNVAGVTDPAEAARLWEKYYEISGGQALDLRKKYAMSFGNAFADIKAEKPDATMVAKNYEPLIQPQYIGPTKIQVPQMDIIAEGEEPMDNTFVLPSLTLDLAYRGMFPNNGLGDYMYMKENNGGNITYPMFMDMIHQLKYGGDLNTQGASFPGEMVYINEGGSHETNPVGGVPVGVDPEGIPNLVEEGETIFNDYVFSNRLEVPKEVKKALGLRGKKKYTFAEASKYLNKEAEERPNDDISERGVENSLANLMMTQEITKQKEENNIMAEGGKIHIAENKKGTFTAAASKHHMGVQEFANKVLANKDKYSPAMVKKANFAKNASHWHALGGNLYFDGSGLRKKTYTDNDLGWDLTNWSNWLNPWGNPIWDYTHPGNTTNHYVPLDITKELVIEAENRDDYKRFMQAMKLDEEGGPNDVALAYMNFYDSRMPNPGNKFYTDKVLRPDWREYANRIMTDHLAGIGHSMAPQVGKRYYYKDTNGNRVYVEAPEDLSKYTIGEGVVDPNDPRWTDYEITGLANTPAAIPEEAAALLTIQEGQKTTNPSEEPLRDYPEYLRYAPAVMSGLGVLTDAFGITNRPDYSLSRGLNRIAANTRYRPVNYTPVGEYLTYTPVDTLKHSIDTQAAHLAVARNLFNTSAGNRGNLQAGLLLNNNAQVVNAGNALFNANIMNQLNKERVGTFNRATDTQNAQGSLHAQTANQHAFMQAQQQRNALMASALEAAVKERELASQNKSRNLINFANNLGLIGRENWAQNRQNWLIRNKYYRRYDQPATTVSKVPATTVTTTKVPEQITVPLRPEELTPEEKAIRNGWIIDWGNMPTYRKCGGKVNRKRKKGLTY